MLLASIITSMVTDSRIYVYLLDLSFDPVPIFFFFLIACWTFPLAAPLSHQAQCVWYTDI